MTKIATEEIQNSKLTQSEEIGNPILYSLIKNEIQQKGFLSFANFMELVLYTPDLGYYASNSEKFGVRGDFVTAPEISDLFSHCLARQCQQILNHLKKLNKQAFSLDILEIGAGTGQMAVDILLELEKLNSLPNHYYIIEISPGLINLQKEKIYRLCPHLLSSVKWITEMPNGFVGVVLGNEILDAMPVDLFQINEEGIQELVVIENDNGLQFSTTSLSTISNSSLNKQALNTNSIKYNPDKQNQLNQLYQSLSWPKNYISEINLNLKSWFANLSKNLKQGVILLIDYGFPRHEYYHTDRDRGTLMCHFKHHAHPDPFIYLGYQDITAHVDFTAVAEAAFECGLNVAGFTNQASFLLATELLKLYEEKIKLIQENHNSEKNNDSAKSIYKTRQALQTLTSPAEMGELFKVIALSKDFDEPLLGFSVSDKRHSL